MVTFTQLIEKFIVGVRGISEWVEIFEKPTKAEMVKSGTPIQIEGEHAEVQDLRAYYLGAILTADNFYVWKRDEIYHSYVGNALDVPLRGQVKTNIPLYAYWIPKINTIRLVLAQWSAGHTRPSKATVNSLIKNLPYFRIFKVVYEEEATFAGAREQW